MNHTVPVLHHPIGWPQRITSVAIATLLALPLLTTASTLPARDELLRTAQDFRDRHAWQAALHAYRQGRQQFPQDMMFQYGEIYALADGNQAEQATALAAQLLERMPLDADALLVMGYAQLRHAGVFAALEYIDRAYGIAGERRYVVRDYVLALQRAHMATAALAVAERHPDLLTPAQMRELQIDTVAEGVRYADLPTRSEAERFQIADRALAAYAQLFSQWSADDQTVQPQLQRARVDRLQALHARFEMAALVQEYEALLAEGVTVPDYSLGSVASAYLYLRMPERSTQVYEQWMSNADLRADSTIRQSQDLGLLYAHADQGDVRNAQALAHPLLEAYPRWRYVEGEPLQVPNSAHMDMRHTVAMMDFYANATPEAQQSLEQMLHTAPNNNNLRTDLAWLYRSRGWPRQAEQTLKIAETYDARGLGVEVGQGLTALDLQEWRQAEQLSADTITRFPEDRRSQRLARLWQVHNMAEWQVSGYKGLSDNNPVAGGRDFGIETTLYSQPLAYNWRLLAGAGHRRASFSDGKGSHNFGRVGLQWRSRDWQVLGEVSSNHFGHGGRAGAGLTASYAIDDYWSLNAGVQWRARDTNLDALRNNIHSNRLDLGVQWRQSERRQWRLSITPSNFSDGNRRWDVLLGGQERLWTRPTWFVDGGLEVFTSHNRRTNVPYYSPRRETSVLPTLTWNHTIHQRYETAWTQQASLGLGSVHQQSYGSGATSMLSYGQRYRRNDVFDVGATLSTLSRPYDGIREREWRLVFDMTFRF